MSIGSLQPALHRTQVALDKLPAGSVVLDQYGHAWQSAHAGGQREGAPSAYWYRSYGDDSEVTSWELAQRGPVRLMKAHPSQLDRMRLAREEKP